MAEAKNASFEHIMKDLEARKFVPVSDVTASQIVDAARRYPMMSEHQVIIVKEAQHVRNTEALERYFKAPMASTILVMCHNNGSIDGRKIEYVKAIQSAGVLFESKKLKDRELPAFIEGYLGRKNVEIDAKSTLMIAENIGSDLSRLTGELDKLILSIFGEKGADGSENAKNGRITPQMVEEQIGVSKEFNGYELRDALINRNVYKANLIIKYFDENPKAGSLYAFLPLLFNYFQNLMIAVVAEWLDMKSPWAAKDYMTGMRNYAGLKVMQIISKIREIDAKSKGLDNPNTPPGELMKELIFYILH